MEPFIFVENESKLFEAAIKEEMNQAIKHFEKDLVTVRTGRASTALVDNIRVECYGQMMGLKELATVSTPDARLITIQPWDKSLIVEIEKAIQASDIGIHPSNDGTVIRLQLPQMSSDRRDELVKILNKKTEDCRVSVRNVRKEFHNQLREAERKSTISEDFARRLADLLQKITDTFITKVDEMHNKKEQELRSI
jgi:ribosome recycling factor